MLRHAQRILKREGLFVVEMRVNNILEVRGGGPRIVVDYGGLNPFFQKVCLGKRVCERRIEFRGSDFKACEIEDHPLLEQIDSELRKTRLPIADRAMLLETILVDPAKAFGDSDRPPIYPPAADSPSFALARRGRCLGVRLLGHASHTDGLQSANRFRRRSQSSHL
jgi:hypothetical protein